MDITALPEEVPGFEVNLENVAVWVIREMRLHGSLPDDITFKLSIDGRPFHGKGARVLYTSPCFFFLYPFLMFQGDMSESYFYFCRSILAVLSVFLANSLSISFTILYSLPEQLNLIPRFSQSTVQ